MGHTMYLCNDTAAPVNTEETHNETEQLQYKQCKPILNSYKYFRSLQGREELKGPEFIHF